MSLWGALFAKPVYVMTSDQDWTPPWAAESLLALLRQRRVPVHLFRTNPCPVFDRAVQRGEITQGWHPNFLAGSTQGQTAPEVLAYLRQHFPNARTLRSHCFFEDSRTWQLLPEAGIVADAQELTFLQEDLVPFLHWTRLVRLPTYFADDAYFMNFGPELSMEPLKQTLFEPGLKVFIFHATFVGANVPSADYYARTRPRIFGTSSAAEGVVYSERGTRNVLSDLIDLVHDHGGQFESFEVVLDRILDRLRAQPERFRFWRLPSLA